MDKPSALPKTLLFLRVSVFLVLLMWTLDKFIRPIHAATVFEKFYFAPALQATILYLIGAFELVIIFAFLLGVKKKLTYGMVFVLHFISTVSSFRQYMAPFEGGNLMFFAAWPMLAACYALYALREHDTLWSFQAKR